MLNDLNEQSGSTAKNVPFTGSLTNAISAALKRN